MKRASEKNTNPDAVEQDEGGRLRETIRLFRLIVAPSLLQHRRRLVAGGSLLIFITLLQLPGPLIMRYVIDDVLPGRSVPTLFIVLAGLAGISLCTMAANIGNRILFVVFRERVLRSMEFDLIRHVQRLTMRYFDANPSGRVLSRIRNDVAGLSGFLGDTLVTTLVDGASFLFGVAVVLLLNWKLSIVAFLILPFFLASLRIFRRPLQDRATDMQEHFARLSSALVEMLEGVKFIKAYNLHETQSERLRDRLQESSRAVIQFSKTSTFSGSVSGVVGSVANVVMWAYGGYEIMQGRLSLGTLFAFLAYIGYVFGPAQRIFALQPQLITAGVALRRIQDLLNEPEEGAGRHLRIRDSDVHGDIVYRDVHFAYTGKPPVLRGINLEIAAGERVAIVGVSGAGKSTMLNLLLGFEDPDSGQVLLDDHDVRNLDLVDLRNAVTLIPQTTFLFSGTVEENIRMGRLDAGREEIEAAAALARAHDFITRFPKGYQTEIGPRGAQLSGGERQRIAIARAALRRPKILVLDEATSEVDAKSEHLIQEALSQLLAGKTAIIVAHRLSCVANADRIVVLDQGRIEATGRHTELYGRNLVYRQLWDLQTTHGE